MQPLNLECRVLRSDWEAELAATEQFSREKYAVMDNTWPSHTTGHVKAFTVKHVNWFCQLAIMSAKVDLLESGLPTNGEFVVRILKYDEAVNPTVATGGLHRDISFCTWGLYDSSMNPLSFYWGLQANELGVAKADFHVFKASPAYERLTAVLFYLLPIPGWLDRIGYGKEIVEIDGAEYWIDDRGSLHRPFEFLR